MSTNFNRKLKPTRKTNPYDIIGTYKANFTGEAGDLVRVLVNDPDDNDFYTNTNVGASFDGVFNGLWVATKTVGKAGVGDPAAAILGITIEGTLSEDQHGNKINGFNERYAMENNAVPTGKPCQIVTEGIFEISADAINGTPAPGSGLVAGADGSLTVIDPEDIVAAGTGTLIVGKCLSTVGANQNSAEVYIKL